MSAAMLATGAPAEAGSLKMLHAFPECTGATCHDGSAPNGNLVMDAAGNLYGTTAVGGKHDAGTIFQLTPDAGGGWSHSTIYSFCSAEDCADGENPQATLIVDTDGNLYGTTQFGGEGEGGGGVVFELTRDRGTKIWNETVLYKFCSVTNCRDGRSPYGGLMADAAGNLFGATQFGGRQCNTAQSNCGVVFMISPNAEHSVSRVLHAFCSADNCADGSTPEGALMLDAFGNLFGATLTGGSNKGGVVYKLQPDGKLHVLQSFCGVKACSGARYPNGVILDGSGHLFGVATTGGKKGGGIVFQLQAD